MAIGLLAATAFVVLLVLFVVLPSVLSHRHGRPPVATRPHQIDQKADRGADEG